MSTYTSDYRTTDQTNQVKPVLKALVIGGLIGAGTMMLLAPQSGKKLRANIASKTNELRERTADTVKEAVAQVKTKGNHLRDDVREKADDFQHLGIDALSEQLDRIAAAAEAGKKALKRAK